MDPVVHFELPANDRERMAEFYSSVFGWEAQMLGPEMGSYTVVTTTETGDDRRPTQPGAINGGLFLRTAAAESQAPSVVIAVADVEQASRAVEAAGGKLSGAPQEIPGIGLYASFFDTEGNRMSMLQPAPPAAAG
ncbi:MAG TPA: VOC family protein [Solirubrobacteraceae bacterium]|jgi:hypothetical protein|nr:VOC family protein [Solirubrobacteraceae bacterium]